MKSDTKSAKCLCFIDALGCIEYHRRLAEWTTSSFALSALLSQHSLNWVVSFHYYGVRFKIKASFRGRHYLTFSDRRT